MADIELVIKIPKELYEDIKEHGLCGYCSDLEVVSKAILNGTPFREICDRENSEIKNEVKDLSKRVETLEKQMKENKEEQLKKLNAELDYAKFRCTL
jgi:predicted  nucleic acid-binding Zn-ribbon protein